MAGMKWPPGTEIRPIIAMVQRDEMANMTAQQKARRKMPITAQEWDQLPPWMKNRKKRPEEHKSANPMVAQADSRRKVCEGCKQFRGESGKLGVHCAVLGERSCSNAVSLHRACPEKRWKRRIVLANHQALGDITVLTGVVRDLIAAHGETIEIGVDTSFPWLWENNPHITNLPEGSGAERIAADYGAALNRGGKSGYHFIQGWAQAIAEAIALQFPIRELKGDIHLTAEEISSPIVDGKYWVVWAGGKYDFQCKWWPPSHYQEVIDRLQGKVRFVQAGNPADWHPRLTGVADLIGKTHSIRDLLRLIYFADGVLCPVTSAMHLAAAVPERPGHRRHCVVIAGAREPVRWEAYPYHQFMHTVGRIDCGGDGCWRSKAMRIGNDQPDCQRPLAVSQDLSIATCMAMITGKEVADRICDCEGLSPMPLVNVQAVPESPERMHIKGMPKIGLVIGTFAGSPYVHLGLESVRRMAPGVRVLVHDDGSRQEGKLRDLCHQYGAEFVSTGQRRRHFVGDMAAFAEGMRWAKESGLDLLVKMSRRFIPLVPWAVDLQALAFDSQYATYSGKCPYWNFGFLTECMAMHVDSWIELGAMELLRAQVSRNEGVFVEAFIHGLARDVHHRRFVRKNREYEAMHPKRADVSGYGDWPLVNGGRRDTGKRTTRLWHETATADEYARTARAWGLEYSADDFDDPNGGEGIGLS